MNQRVLRSSIVLTVLATLLVGIVVVVPKGAAQGATVLSGPLHTAGNQILDASDNPVRLRGLNDQVIPTPTGVGISDDEIGHARDWGANIVRVQLNEDSWTQLCPTTIYNRSYVANIDAVVNEITSRGMVALLTESMNPRYPCDVSQPEKMAAYPWSILFWQSVATRYKDNPLVAFDLYNEPHDISDSVWLSGGTINDIGAVWQAAGMQQLYSGVRGAGADNLVFVSGTNWSSSPASQTVSGTNVVYAAHMYTCPHNPPPNCTTTQAVGPFGIVKLTVPYPNPYDPTSLMNRWTTFETQHPLVITEFGWPASNDGRYNGNLIAGAEQNHLGWIAYGWDGGTKGKFNMLLNSGPGAAYDPAPSGVPVKNGLSVSP